MRHLIGFALGLALAAAVFFGASWGYLRLLRIPVAGGAVATLPAGGGSLLHDKNVLLAFAALAGVGLLAGVLIALPRISPLAAGLPGVVLIAWTVFYLVSVQRAVKYIPLKGDAFGRGFEALLINGMLAAAGLALIVPLFIPSRWYRADLPMDVEPGRLAPASPTGASSVLLQNDWGNETAPIDQPPPF
ncbi:MAG TPA: hypothetical protein VH589_31525 [Trebonia sp.]|jgi:hypothetical protein